MVMVMVKYIGDGGLNEWNGIKKKPEKFQSFGIFFQLVVSVRLGWRWRLYTFYE